MHRTLLTSGEAGTRPLAAAAAEAAEAAPQAARGQEQEAHHHQDPGNQEELCGTKAFLAFLMLLVLQMQLHLL